MKAWLLCVPLALVGCGTSGPDTGASGDTAVLSPPSNTGDVITPAAPIDLAGMKLVWSDEFDVDGLPDATKWVHDTGRNREGWHNNELQYYADKRLENARVENGRLIITARKERLSTAADFGGQNYTSARLITRGLASWTYGHVTVRAKLPCGRGTWPAIWMLGSGGAWPDDGEIDILEQSGQNKAEVFGTIHTRAYNYNNGTLGVGQGARQPLPNACTAFNNYHLTWTAEKIVIGVNGQNYFEFKNPKNGDTTRWPFDRPQFLLLNLAVGGHLGGAVDDNAMPAEMVVDHVRVYQPLQ